MDYNAWANDPLGWMHFLLALTGLISGGLIFLWHKGTRRHRIAGYLYVFSMGTTNVSALLIYDLTKSFNLFHFFAVFSLAVLIAAFWSIRKFVGTRENKHIARHGHFMAWSWLGLVMAAVAETVTRLFDDLLLGPEGWWPFLVFLGLSMTAAIYITGKLTRRFIPQYASPETGAPCKPEN
jgi:uncharacterized membrane protein